MDGSEVCEHRLIHFIGLYGDSVDRKVEMKTESVIGEGKKAMMTTLKMLVIVGTITGKVIADVD